jgi:hypothetical protein
MNVTLIGPDNVEAVVGISESATVRDVATYKYHLFWRITKRNDAIVSPFTTDVIDGDTVHHRK